MTGHNQGGKRTKRRKFLKGTGALAVASAAAGCSGNKKNKAGSNSGSGGGDGGDGGDGGGGAKTTQKLPSFENKAGVKVGETFEAVQELAKEEDTATVYATIDRGPFQKWIDAFTKAHPQASVNHVTGGNEKLGSRWATEYETDNVKANIYISTSGIYTTWQNNQVMELGPDIMPSFGEAPDKFKSSKGNWIATRQVLGNIHYNKDMVSASDADNWMDVVTNSDWQGQKIGWDPTPNMFLMSWLLENQGKEFFEALHDADPRWVDSHTDLARLCGAGEYPVCFTYTHKMGRFGNKMPLSYFKFDPTPSVISPMVISNKAPQPNTALLFANWLTSKEGQMTLGKTQYIPWHPDAKYTAYEGVYPSDEYEVDTIRPTADIEKTQKMWKNTLGDLISPSDTD